MFAAVTTQLVGLPCLWRAPVALAPVDEANESPRDEAASDPET